MLVNVVFDIGKVESDMTKKFQSFVTPSQNVLTHNLSLENTYLC